MKKPREPSAEISLSALDSTESGDTPQPSFWRERVEEETRSWWLLSPYPGLTYWQAVKWEVAVYVLPWGPPAASHVGWDVVGSSIPPDFSTLQELGLLLFLLLLRKRFDESLCFHYTPLDRNIFTSHNKGRFPGRCPAPGLQFLQSLLFKWFFGTAPLQFRGILRAA